MKKVICVEGMSCNHCKSAVEKAVKGLTGVVSVEVSLENRSVAVEYDDNLISLNNIKEAVIGCGFEVL